MDFSGAGLGSSSTGNDVVAVSPLDANIGDETGDGVGDNDEDNVISDDEAIIPNIAFDV